MKTYKIVINRTVSEEMVIEAETKNAAWKKAKDNITASGNKGVIKSIKEVKSEVIPEPVV